MTFTGMRALVTGGASGIGWGVSTLLAERGAQVAVLDRQPPAATPPRSRVRSVVADVTDDAAVRSAVDEAAVLLGGLDIVVNNAGVGAVGSVEDNDDDEWRRVYDVNVLGAVRVSRAALPHLRRSEHPCIVMTCSVAASVGLPQRALYSATKGALVALTMAMAADHLVDGIRVNAVTPGTADTPWVQRLLDASADPEQERRALEARQPTGRLVTVAEVAEAIAYLASPSSGSTTATVLAVDGGMANLRVRTPVV